MAPLCSRWCWLDYRQEERSLGRLAGGWLVPDGLLTQSGNGLGVSPAPKFTSM